MRRILVAAISLALFSAACGPGESSENEDTGFPPINTADVADTGINPDTMSPDTGVDASDTATDDAGDAGDTADTSGMERLPVTEMGRYGVGYTEFDVTYQARQDGTDEKRTLNVSAWYPTNDEKGRSARYLDGAFAQEDLSDVDVMQNATPIEAGDRPLLVFSHGNGGIAEQNYFISEFWASHGWVVVSPDHTGNTFKSGTSINLEAAIYRPQDVSAVLDHVYNFTKDDRLGGDWISTDDVALSGHSFGGYTTLASSGADYAVEDLRDRCDKGTVNEDYCEVFDQGDRPQLFKEGFYDDRIKVAIPQTPAGALIFQDGLADIQIPTMLMTGGMDNTLPNSEEGDPIWNMMKGSEHRRVNLPKGGHFTFSNMCDLPFGTVEQIANDGCADRFIEPEKAYDIINTYALAFARYHLFDDMKAKEIIDGDRHPVGMSGFELSVGAK